MSKAITVILSLYFFQNVNGQCNNTGEWAEWQEYGACAQQLDGSYANVRYRDCDPLPVGCIAESAYICNGEFTSSLSCDGTSSTRSSSLSTTVVITTARPTLPVTSHAIVTIPETTTTTTSVPTTESSSTTTTETTTTTQTTTTTTPTTTSTTTSSTASPTLPGDNQLPTCSWADWGQWSSCTDTCGMCGNQQRFRTCSSTDCTCSGSSFENVGCAPLVCLYPRSSCCSGYSPNSNGTAFVCQTSSG